MGELVPFQRMTDIEIAQQAFEMGRRARVAIQQTKDPKQAAGLTHDIKAIRDRISKMNLDFDALFEWTMAWLEGMVHSGRMLAKMEKNLGSLLRGSTLEPRGEPTLASLGIDKKESFRWQRLGRIKGNEFKAWEKALREEQQQPTFVALWRLMFGPTNSPFPEMGDGYRVIYADPPWDYGNPREPSGRFTEQTDYYETMSLEAICAIPVKQAVTDNAVLFLWTTSAYLEKSFEVIKAWGFKYKTTFVWNKMSHNPGHYNSVQHEILLVATRGACTPDIPKLVPSVVSIKRGLHSEKPEKFREIIDLLYPKGKRAELFARRKVGGWDTYGNQISGG